MCWKTSVRLWSCVRQKKILRQSREIFTAYPLPLPVPKSERICFFLPVLYLFSVGLFFVLWRSPPPTRKWTIFLLSVLWVVFNWVFCLGTALSPSPKLNECLFCCNGFICSQSRFLSSKLFESRAKILLHCQMFCFLLVLLSFLIKCFFYPFEK